MSPAFVVVAETKDGTFLYQQGHESHDDALRDFEHAVAVHPDETTVRIVGQDGETMDVWFGWDVEDDLPELSPDQEGS